MKKYVFFLYICLSVSFVQAQIPVTSFSEWLSVDTSFVLLGNRSDINRKNWVATVAKDNFYCCQRNAFHANEKNYCCVIRCVNLNTYEQDSILINYPALGSSWKREAQACCLYALSFEEEMLLLVCDNQLLLYQLDKNEYKFVRRLFCIGVYTGYLHQHKIYAVVDDKERGVFRWICYEDNADQKSFVVRELTQSAPFLLQFDPNRYLFVNEHFLYYLSPGDCWMQKFSLRGDMLDSVRFEVPGWRPLPRDFLSQSQSLPYGTERIYHALNHRYRQYSFAKTIDPLSDSLFFLSVNLGDECRQRQMAVLRLQKNGNDWRQDISTLAVIDTGKIYQSGLFPTSYHLSADNLLVYPHQNSLLQLLLAPEKEEFEGRSVMQYRRYKDVWFKEHDPVVKFRMQKVREDCKFYDYDNRYISLTDLNHDKVILVVNQQPQCSACLKHLLKLLSQIDTSHLAVACFMGKVDSYLYRRQQLQQMAEICPKYFQSLYAAENEDYGVYTASSSYPAVFFWQRGFGIVGEYAAGKIFTADYSRYEFSESFLNDFSRFVSVDN